MFDLTIEKIVQDIRWTSLGEDVRGTCDVCTQDRPLKVQFVPDNKWMCRPCANEAWAEQERPE